MYSLAFDKFKFTKGYNVSAYEATEGAISGIEMIVGSDFDSNIVE